MTPRIGIDLGGTKIELVVLGADGGVVHRERVATPAGSYEGTLAAVAGLVARADAVIGGPPAPVGVGTPGSETAAGTIKNANSTCLNGRPLRADLSALLGREVRLANDANCLALSEATDGAGAGHRTVFAVILGTGVGAGIVVDGRLLVGPNGLAGEWGHNPLPWADARELREAPGCYCGKRGCIEAWLSGPGLARDHGGDGDALAIATAARGGDAAATAALTRHADRLARALAHVVNLLDPDVIVLGGGVSRLPGLVPAVTARCGAYVFSAGADAPPRTPVVLSLHGDSSGVRGAACLG